MDLWSGVEKLVSRQPHKLKTVGSSPTSATNCFQILFFHKFFNLFIDFYVGIDNSVYPFVILYQINWFSWCTERLQTSIRFVLIPKILPVMIFITTTIILNNPIAAIAFRIITRTIVSFI